MHAPAAHQSKRLARPRLYLVILALCSGAILVGSLGAGAFSISWGETVAVLWKGITQGTSDTSDRHLSVIWNLRMPRIVMGFITGGVLGICGAALQGLFRNPLADPALIGVTGGAAVGAVTTIVLGAHTFLASSAQLAFYSVPVGAFIGAFIATFFVFRVATWQGQVRVATLLLAGIAVNAFAGSAIGWLTYIATDNQLRELSFWSLGSLAAVGWKGVFVAAPLVVISSLIILGYSRALNALSLGESNARYMGAPVGRMKTGIVVATALGVGAVVALTGVISFVGLIAPHLVRMTIGADHRWVLPGSFLLGGSFLCVADVVSRVAVAPAEIPVGIVVATIGAPFFLFLLLRDKRRGVE